MTDEHDKAVVIKPQNLDMVARPDIVHPLAKAMLASGAPITPESVKQMLDLQQQWEANEARKMYTRALVDLKRDLPSVVAHNKKGHTNTYTDLAALIDAVTPHLARHGFSVSWSTEPSGTDITVACVLTHCGGHAESIAKMTAAQDSQGAKSGPQKIASTMTYLQRYTLRSALGLATSDLPDMDARARDPNKVDTSANLKIVARLSKRGISLDDAEKLTGKDHDQWTVGDRAAVTDWAKKLLGDQ